LRQLVTPRDSTIPPPPPKSLSFRHFLFSVLTAALSRDEKYLLTCDSGGHAHLWDVAKGERLRSFPHGTRVRGAAFSPDESLVLTWGEEGATLWETGTGKEKRRLKHPAGVRGVVFGPNGSHVLTWDADYTARWWDLSRDEPLYKFVHDRDLFGARLDRKG